MTTSLQMIQCSATAIPFPPCRWVNAMDSVSVTCFCACCRRVKLCTESVLHKVSISFFLVVWYHDNFIANDSMQCNCHPLSTLAVDKHNRLRCLSHAFCGGVLISNYPCQSAGAIPALLQWQGNSKSCLATPVRVLEVKSAIPALLQVAG